MRGSMLGVMIATACALVGEARPAEACSPWPSGVTSRSVLPEDGAVDVPTNARVVVTYGTTDGSTGEIALRVQGGAEVAVPAERVSNDGWHVSLELAAALEPSTTYEVLDRLDLECAYDSAQDCLGDPEVIATFTTGTEPDTTPPVLLDVSTVESFDCSAETSCPYSPNLAIHAVRIGGVVDDGPAGWVRYLFFDASGEPVAGPTELLATASYCGGPGSISSSQHVLVPFAFQLRAVDLAGNVEQAAHAIEGSRCEELWGGTACDPEPPDGGDGGNGDGADGGGCHVGAPGSGGFAVVLVIALGAAMRRRRRLAALLVVAPTWVAFDARPAEACLPWPRGITGRGVLPESGAGDVPTNARVLVTYVGVDGFTGDVSLRVQGGALVPATITVVPGGGFSASLEIDAELQPSTTYEVLDRLDLECAFNTWNACLGDPVVISTFTTGTAVDTEPPRLVDLLRVESNAYCGGFSATGCYEPSLVTHEFELGAAEDDGPERWIQYEYLDGAGAVVARVGPLHTAALHCGGSGEPWWGTVVYVPEAFEIRAVDLAGNAELVAHGPFTASCAVLDEDACGPSPPDAGSGQPPDASGDPATGGGGGCAAAASPGGWLLLLALAVLLARRRRTVGALLVVVPTWVAVDARPAEACSPWPAGVFDRTVIPESGATEVPTNARVTVSYDTHGGNPGSTLTLRPQGGEPVEATTLDAYGWGNHRTVIPTQSLLPGTVYEVLDTLDLACAMDGAPDCLGEPVVIATFTTGQDADVSPPRLVDVSVTSRFVCNRDTSCSDSADHTMNTIAISAIEDDRPTAWVRIQYLEATGALITGPAPLVPTGHGCSGGSGPGWMRYLRMPEEFQIRAIDIAGNVELVAHPIIGGSCEALAEGTACDLTPGDDEPDDPEAPADGGGCSTGTPSGGAVVPVLLVILLVAGPRGHLRRTR